MPLLIGGATTSRVHTAVKIDPHYARGQAVYVPTRAARSASSRRCCRRSARPAYVADVRAEYAQGRRRACARRGRQAAPAARQGARQRASRSTGPATRRRSRPSSARACSTSYDLAELVPLHRLDAVLPDLGAEGPLPGDPRRPRSARRRAQLFDDAQAMLRADHRRALVRAEGGRRLLAGQRRRRRHRALHRREPRPTSSRRFHACASSCRSATASPTCALADFVAPRDERQARLHRRLRRHRRHRGGARSPSASSAPTTTTRRSWSRRSPTASPRPSPSACTSACAREFWGYAPDETLRHERADRRAVSRHPPGARLSGAARPHREGDAVPAARRRAHASASS